ncbi:MAG: energy transducer TonB [candidate division Zixibacteria bacterium]|nr:energy transducer TonB [candidate division Zixibacteria bacterium]
MKFIRAEIYIHLFSAFALVVIISCSNSALLTPPDCGSEPTLIENVEPEYPRLARNAGLEDDIVLSYVVDIFGRVRDIKIIQSNIEMLGEAAVRAVNQYKYSPAICYGRPVESEVTTTIEFRLP